MLWEEVEAAYGIDERPYRDIDHVYGFHPSDTGEITPYEYIVPAGAFERNGLIHAIVKGDSFSLCMSCWLFDVYPQSTDEALAIARGKMCLPSSVTCLLCWADLINTTSYDI